MKNFGTLTDDDLKKLRDAVHLPTPKVTSPSNFESLCGFALVVIAAVLDEEIAQRKAKR